MAPAEAGVHGGRHLPRSGNRTRSPRKYLSGSRRVGSGCGGRTTQHCRYEISPDQVCKPLALVDVCCATDQSHPAAVFEWGRSTIAGHSPKEGGRGCSEVDNHRRWLYGHDTRGHRDSTGYVTLSDVGGRGSPGKVRAGATGYAGAVQLVSVSASCKGRVPVKGGTGGDESRLEDRSCGDRGSEPVR